MRSKRLGVRSATLCLALAGLMAVSAASAQAEVGAAWLVQGVAVTDALKAELTATLENNHGVLLGEIGGKGIHVLCTGMNLGAGNTLKINGTWLGIALFSGCKILQLTVLNGATAFLGSCTPPGGHITTELLKGLLSLHKLVSGAADTVVVIEPEVGTVLAVIITGSECPFGEKIKINGKLAVIDTEVGVSKVSHLIREFVPLTKLFINGNEANKVTLDGSAEVKLTGHAQGLSWSGDPA